MNRDAKTIIFARRFVHQIHKRDNKNLFTRFVKENIEHLSLPVVLGIVSSINKLSVFEKFPKPDTVSL